MQPGRGSVYRSYAGCRAALVFAYPCSKRSYTAGRLRYHDVSFPQYNYGTERSRKFTFKLNENVKRTELRFKNCFGIELAADLYFPKNIEKKKSSALVIGGPFGAVKEQASGFYANEMAALGFVTLAFDGSYTGESGGIPRHVASPDISTEDFMAAVDELGLQPNVDRERIGMIGLCGWGGFALNAASIDKRVKAVITVSMYNISAMGDVPTAERTTTLNALANQRWIDAENRTNTPGADRFPNGYPENEPDEGKNVYNYYRTERGFHENSILSNSTWNATMPLSFMATKIMQYIDEISPRPILLIAGDKALTKPHTDWAYEHAKEPKELYVVKDAGHATLYDQKDKIPFQKINDFFNQHL
ncbi:alpha/beta hydrolase [Paenibacillus dauci]|uniref:alpha/beta hydrolase n=1 Tax=Paenibacillus dauci TaxID=1567106 RepID=UPI000A6473FB|nr:alpha/beta hydrolase [Paenibacillus dauci]